MVFWSSSFTSACLIFFYLIAVLRTKFNDWLRLSPRFPLLEAFPEKFGFASGLFLGEGGSPPTTSSSIFSSSRYSAASSSISLIFMGLNGLYYEVYLDVRVGLAFSVAFSDW
jgi:hypothetical protein